MDIKEENQLLRSTLSTFVNALSLFIIADGKLHDLSRAELLQTAESHGIYAEPDIARGTLEDCIRCELRIKLWQLVQTVKEQQEILER